MKGGDHIRHLSDRALDTFRDTGHHWAAHRAGAGPCRRGVPPGPRFAHPLGLHSARPGRSARPTAVKSYFSAHSLQRMLWPVEDGQKGDSEGHFLGSFLNISSTLMGLLLHGSRTPSAVFSRAGHP